MNTSVPDRRRRFAVIEGKLVIYGRPRSGKDYEHACELAVLEEVAHTIDELGGASFTGEELARQTGQPSTQVFTALALLYDRGIIETTRGRRKVPASIDVHLDAMIEYHALAEGLGPDGDRAGTAVAPDPA